MFELFAIILLSRTLGRRLRAKGYKSIPYQLLLILCWFASEFAGAFLIAILFHASGISDNTLKLLAYAGGLALAILTTFLLFLHAKKLPPKPTYANLSTAFPVTPATTEPDDSPFP